MVVVVVGVLFGSIDGLVERAKYRKGNFTLVGDDASQGKRWDEAPHIKLHGANKIPQRIDVEESAAPSQIQD